MNVVEMPSAPDKTVLNAYYGSASVTYVIAPRAADLAVIPAKICN